MVLNFGVRMGSGALCVVWPITIVFVFFKYIIIRK